MLVLSLAFACASLGCLVYALWPRPAVEPPAFVEDLDVPRTLH